MFKSLRRKLTQSDWAQRALAKPIEMRVMQPKPSIRFLVGIGVIGFSYLMAWPFIGVLGIISLSFDEPRIVAIGGPLAYGLSYLVFFLGIWLAGKESLIYLKRLNHLAVGYLIRKLSVPED